LINRPAGANPMTKDGYMAMVAFALPHISCGFEDVFYV
jgi:hypothetical protein